MLTTDTYPTLPAVHAIDAEYVCPYCRKRYLTETDALECANSTPPATFKVGDIVVARHNTYGWYEGYRSWILSETPDEKTRHGYRYTFYYVVTKVTFESHRPTYHLQTKAQVKQGIGGVTYDTGHFTPVLVTNPPAHIVAESKELIGRDFTGILL